MKKEKNKTKYKRQPLQKRRFNCTSNVHSKWIPVSCNENKSTANISSVTQTLK